MSTHAPRTTNPELASAYSYCERVARQHYENFPVASFLLPAAARPHIAAVYAFARVADDLADEGDVPPAERLAALDKWSARLLAAAYGEPQARDEHANVFLALSNTIRTCRLQVPLLQDLAQRVSAGRDRHTLRELGGRARLLPSIRQSCRPAGVEDCGYEDPALDVKADAVCTALQVTNFLQDLQIDWRRGRLYVPREFWQPAGARETDLDAAQLTPEWRVAVREVARRTRLLFTTGRSVCDGVDGRLRFELRATWLGGMRILDRLERAQFDVFAHRPTLGATDAAAIAWRVIRWS